MISLLVSSSDFDYVHLRDELYSLYASPATKTKAKPEYVITLDRAESVDETWLLVNSVSMSTRSFKSAI